MKTFRYGFTAFVLLTLALSARGQSTALSYQGRLSTSGGAANGLYDFLFVLREGANTNFAQVGPPLNIAPVAVTDGMFHVSLDFGTGIFTGAPRWLEISVRTNGSPAPHVALTPAQRIASTPYAMQALVASNVLGNVSDTQLSTNVPRLNANQQFNGSVTFNPFSGAPFLIGNANTNRVVWLNADLLDGFDSAAFARSNHAHSALDIVNGTLSDARLSANVALLNDHQSFSGSNIFSGSVVATNVSNAFGGNGGALFVLNAGALTGAVASAVLPAHVARTDIGQTFLGTPGFSAPVGAPFTVGSSNAVANLNADWLDGFTSASFWNVGGNNAASNHFLGTLNSEELEFRVNAATGLRIQPAAVPNVVGGSIVNGVSNAAAGTVIGGGTANVVAGNYAVIGGGNNNTAAGTFSTVGGGTLNRATNTAAAVPGGENNIAGGRYSLAAGRNARALHESAFVWADNSTASTFSSTASNTVLFRANGGVGINTNAPANALHVAGTVQSDNLKLTAGATANAVLVSDAAGNAAWQQPAVRVQTNGNSPNVIGGHLSNSVAPGVVGGTIGGGGSPAASNSVSGNYGTISGGAGNRVIGTAGSVGGGTNNVATNYATVPGGLQNSAAGEYSFVGGGANNVASNFAAAVSGGISNVANGIESVIAGGFNNRASGQRAFVGGGTANSAEGTRSVIAGGDNNRATNSFGTVGGGFSNTNSGSAATIAGGQNNAATNVAATVPGGSGNVAGGQYSFAAGRNARAVHDGAFTWADASTSAAFSSTAANEFAVRAAGGANLFADIWINDNDLHLRNRPNADHGLGWYGPSPLKTFANAQPDGPVLYGFAGGALGTKSGGERVALAWNTGGVGIGTNSPQQPLSVAGGAVIDQGDANIGTANNALRFGSFSGEAIGSKRNAGGNQFGLDFYTGGFNRMAVLNNGRIGIGTVSPNDRFEVVAPDAAVRIKNSNDGGLGGFIENTFGSLQFGMFAESNAVAQLAGGEKRALFGFAPDGRVGSLVNVLTTPSNESFRNLIDDGAGNASVSSNLAINGNANFGTTTRQMLNLWSGQYGIGVQGWTLYQRSDRNFAWYRFGTHGETELDPGAGGSELMRLTPSELRVTANDITVRGSGNEQAYVGGDGVGADAEFGSFNSAVDNAVMWNRARGDRLNLYVKTLFESSDRELKAGFEKIEPQEILAKVLALPIERWHFRGDETNRHIGPMAQDFRAAFGLGRDDKSIASVDANGVALAAIQGLNIAMEAKEARIKELEARLIATERQLTEQRKLHADWESRLAALEKQRASFAADASR